MVCTTLGQKFEIIDTYLVRDKNFIHKLESSLLWITFSLVFTIFFAFSFVKWGIPTISNKIAHSLPLSVNNLIAKNTLKTLDTIMLKDSKLSSTRKEAITSIFRHKLLAQIDKNDKINYKLHFRHWEYNKIGIANAFALPNGDIVLTDKFVQLSQNADEINSVLLHEIGHIEKRHSLQRLIESSFIAFIVMFISGDGTMVSDMGIGLGSLLVSSEYSRNHESEADLFAFEKMLTLKIDPKNFSSIMKRITNDLRFEQETKTLIQSDEKNGKDIIDYLSSHPNSLLRIKMANQYSDCFKQGLLLCTNN